MTRGEDRQKSLGPGAPTSVSEQIRGLALLPDGWLDGEGIAPDAAGLQWLEPLLAGVVDSFELPRPFIYPTPEGRARAEWPGESHEVIAESDIARKEVDLFAIPAKDAEIHELKLTFAASGAEARLAAFLTKHLGASASDE